MKGQGPRRWNCRAFNRASMLLTSVTLTHLCCRKNENGLSELCARLIFWENKLEGVGRAFARPVGSIHPAGSEQKGAGGSRRRLLRCIERWRNGSARSRALGGGIHGVERLARGHEKAGSAGGTAADVGGHLG